MRVHEIDRLSILLSVDGRPALALDLAADGGVRRLGNGDEPADGQAVQGMIDTAVFDAVRAHMNSDMLARAGRYGDPDPAGTPTDLTVKLGAGDEETGLAFRYGSESRGPPQHVADLVRMAVALTDDWFAQQTGAADQ